MSRFSSTDWFDTVLWILVILTFIGMVVELAIVGAIFRVLWAVFK